MSERAGNPLVDQFRRGGVPKDLRLMAAQGLLPLKPEDLVELLILLLGDSEEGVRNAAQASLAAMPAGDMQAILKSRDTPAAVLAWGLANREEKELREVALQNPSTPDEAVEALAGTLPEPLAELIVINQVRLLRRTSLLLALEGNPNLSSDQRRRLRELRESFHIGEETKAPPGPARAPTAAVPPPPPAAPEPAVEEGPIAGEDLTPDEAIARVLSDEERQQEDKISAVQRLYRMNTAEKMITALKGSREERTILIRDPNRIVSTAVLGSPKLTEAEVEGFAAMKNVSGDVLRYIGNHKEWTKKYTVVQSLVRNPRTPLAISLGMVSRLNPKDLKTIAVDRNVPEVIRKQAQRFVKGPQGGPGGGPGGGKH
jgi:hypothetical protein